MMQSVFKVKRLKVNSNLGKIDDFTPERSVNVDEDPPSMWEEFKWHPKGEKRPRIYCKIFLISGASFIADMSVKEWEEYYSKFLEVYQIAIDNKNPEPIKES